MSSSRLVDGEHAVHDAGRDLLVAARRAPGSGAVPQNSSMGTFELAQRPDVGMVGGEEGDQSVDEALNRCL
jgi:hypothetical protein